MTIGHERPHTILPALSDMPATIRAALRWGIQGDGDMTLHEGGMMQKGAYSGRTRAQVLADIAFTRSVGGSPRVAQGWIDMTMRPSDLQVAEAKSRKALRTSY